MKRFFTAVATTMAFVASPVLADPETKGAHTMDAKGCMMLLECTNGVTRIRSVSDLKELYPEENWGPLSAEISDTLAHLDAVGIPTYVGDRYYFARNERALYDTANNRMFISDRAANKPWSFMSSFRHEGWHAAQDCMAGGIDNKFLGVIYGSEGTPAVWTSMAERLYPANIVEWEAEAKWAGNEVDMTRNALAVCATTGQKPWTVMEPTPLTREWLTRNGHIK
jgi:hypothetical protein